MQNPLQTAPPFYQKSVEQALEALGASIGGLASEDAEKRLQQYGPNDLQEKKRATLFSMFMSQFKDFMILVLIAAAVISGIIGEVVDTLAIIVIVVLNAVLGFIQEYRAKVL